MQAQLQVAPAVPNMQPTAERGQDQELLSPARVAKVSTGPSSYACNGHHPD